MFSQITLSTTRRVPTGDVWVTGGSSILPGEWDFIKIPPGGVDFVGPLSKLPGTPGTVPAPVTIPITPVSMVQKAGFDLSALFTKEGWPILGILAIGLIVASRNGGVDRPRRRRR